MKFDSAAADVPVILQSDWTILNTNLAALRLHEILQQEVLSDVETGPCLLTESWDPFYWDRLTSIPDG